MITDTLSSHNIWNIGENFQWDIVKAVHQKLPQIKGKFNVAQRGQQGTDIVVLLDNVEEFPFSIEAKLRNTGLKSLYKYMEQAVEDRNKLATTFPITPVVVVGMNDRPRLWTLREHDFFNLVKTSLFLGHAKD